MATGSRSAKSSSLSSAECSKLVQLEDVIATAHRWMVESAKALLVIRDRKLYRATFPTFESYARERWGYERAYLYQLCQWGEVVNNLSAIADIVPERESHARPLYPLSPADQRNAWERVLEKTMSPTARDIEAVVASLRPTLRRVSTSLVPYYGSKASLAEQIIAEFPPHRCYVETHAGGASVLASKARSAIEVVNDIDDALVNFYRVMRRPAGKDGLIKALRMTPFAYAEWDLCRKTMSNTEADEVERARRFFVSFSMGYCGTVTGFSRSCRKPQADYHVARVERLDAVAERLRRVVVEHADAIKIIDRYDSAETLFYIDPPYPREARPTSSSSQYRFEMTFLQHEQLLARLARGVEGKVLLSGQACPLYAKHLSRWRTCWRHRVPCAAAGANKRGTWRTEILWANW